ncbi:hypothetical protein LZZ85_19040 [Terrimonas sp. NA20]|uniref:Outer membrane protein beta-barrel domain-containing protein n=1 Tax=Terrimonas ginsenosidimutans TaxID=2908004 RepID=A0ABS9KVY3_9BACT|nr:hypothetical protein [Terrimonas ginsenosidimutans]MCG2616404.1 hypothetical protein [Terrimonas ginsenosidimutans]
MKKTVILLLTASLFVLSVKAQDEDAEKKGFKKENLFTGGSLTVSFFNSQTVLGTNPIFGYKLADWVDAGVVVNYVYSSIRNYRGVPGDKLRQTTFGPGVFTRLYPVNFLFAQAQYEKNFFNVKYIPSGAGSATFKETGNAPSFLLGGGFASGRQPGSNTFFYIAVLFDVIKDVNSPYVNVVYDPANPSSYVVDMVPIIRAGVNVGLFQNRYR